MIVSVKKVTILVVLGIFTACVIGAYAVINFSGSASQIAGVKMDKVIVIDAGHGGIDGGVVGTTTGVKESDINLAISKKLESFLVMYGYTVVQTRTTTEGLYGLATTNRKAIDLEARKNIIQKANPDMVISIHQNSFTSPTVSGAQVFYTPNSEVSYNMSLVMQSTLNSLLSCSRVSKAGDYYIIQCTSYPSLLIECGFLSNRDEEQLLVTAEYQEKVAYSIFSGINTIFMPE